MRDAGSATVCAAAAALLSVSPLFAADKINYQDHVLPIFRDSCLNCHNPDKKKAGLDLSTWQTALAGTELEKAQCGTIRRKLLKIGAQVRVTVRKVWVSLSSGYPYATLFSNVLATLEKANAVP